MNIKTPIIFMIGAAIGSVVTWQFVKTKYERIAQEEIDSVKEVFHDKQQQLLELNKNKVELDVYKRILDNAKYDHVMTKKEEAGLTDDDIIITEEEAENELRRMEGMPEVIRPSEFGEYDDYESESLNYYADGVLTTIFGDIIPEEDIDEIVGEESLTRFGEYEMDTVYVRNDNRNTYYEILRDNSKYSELYGDDVEME